MAFEKITVENAYRGTIVDAVAGKTKNGFPQAVIRFRAEEAANDKGEFEALEAQAQIAGYFVLFNSTEMFNEQTTNLNYGQLKRVGQWNDAKFSFQEIAKLTNKKAYFRCANEEYNGKTNMKIVWVDDYESDGTTTLKSVSDQELTAMNSLLKFSGAQGGLPGSAPVVAAKRGRPAAVKKETPAENPTVAPAVSTAPSPVAASVVKKSGPPESEPELLPDVPAEMTKTQAWEYVNEQAGVYSENAVEGKKIDDTQIGLAWLSAIKKVGGVQATYTGKEWSRVCNEAIVAMIPF